MKNPRALVILSGGQDSTTVLFQAAQRHKHVHAITFDYGQRHDIEIESAKTVAALAGCVEHHILAVGPVLGGRSPLVSNEVLEQYEGMYSLPGGLEKTFVPGRNLLFLTLAANFAYTRAITDVYTGVCEEDYGGYPDCRQKFIDAAQLAIREGMAYGDDDPFKDFTIHTPLMNLTKADTVRLARDLPGCWEALAYTHTAYDGEYPPVGKDHASLLRARGFLEAMLPDPLVLRAVREGLMDLPDTPNYS